MLHSVPPLVVFVAAEAVVDLRDKLTEAVNAAFTEAVHRAEPVVHERPRTTRRSFADYLADARHAWTPGTEVTPAWVREVTSCSRGLSSAGKFVAFAEDFARRHRLPSTLSLRHLLRLVSGRKADGSPLGTPRPATTNLLERIFGVPVDDLLSAPRSEPADQARVELRQRLNAARHVDMAVIDLLREQLDSLRRLDRQMGAIVAYGEVREKAEQVRQLHAYSLTPSVRVALAGVLSELGALAGWEALDRYEIGRAWEHHESAKQAARDANAPGLLAHALAQQAFVLSELGEVRAAVEQLADARTLLRQDGPRLLRAWLAAAHGEGLAVAGRRDEALRAFDEAGALLPADTVDPALPFLFFGGCASRPVAWTRACQTWGY